jgi:AcrR family transcriptional regulator
MVAAAATMISTRGVVPTSMRELGKAGGPLGSIYHYFPGGKDQLISEAIELVGRRVERLLQPAADRGAIAALDAFVTYWRELLVTSDFQAGCAVFAVANDGTGQVPRATETAAATFNRWQDIIADALQRDGVDADHAGRMAWLVLSGLEGAVALSRVCRDVQPLEQTGRQLQALVQSAVADATRR